VTVEAVPIQAVLWDFGGVFTTSPFDAFSRYERERGLPVDIIRRINAANPDTNAWAQIERAEIDAGPSPSCRSPGPPLGTPRGSRLSNI
jgi:hypothetical protein